MTSTTGRHRKSADIVSYHSTTGERFNYVVANIVTLGTPYMAKLIIKKAVAEAIVLTDQARG